MTTYKGETIDPQMADEDEIEILTKIEKVSDRMKKLAEEYQRLLAKLPAKTPLVAEVDGEYRTHVVDVPKGHFITYRENELAMNAKTTKADLKTLGL